MHTGCAAYFLITVPSSAFSSTVDYVLTRVILEANCPFAAGSSVPLSRTAHHVVLGLSSPSRVSDHLRVTFIWLCESFAASFAVRYGEWRILVLHTNAANIFSIAVSLVLYLLLNNKSLTNVSCARIRAVKVKKGCTLGDKTPNPVP